MSTPLPLVAGTLADQECWTTPQALYEEMFSKGSATMPDITGILIQDDPPDPADRGVKGWIPTSGGVPLYPGYVFIWHAVAGHWVSRHPIPADDDRIQLYVGTLASIDTLDGGTAGVVTPYAGPFWERDTRFDGRFPVGVGAIPGSSPAATIVDELDTSDSLGNSGEYQHTLTEAEGAVGNHIHPIGVCDPATDDGFFPIVTPAVAVPNWSGHYITGSGSTPATPETTANLQSLKAGADGAGVVSDPHNNMPPYLSVYFIKRTGRTFFVEG